MPPFVDSFGDQFTAVIINTIGTILSGVFVSLFGSFVTNVISPFLESLFGTGM
ncbi:MAG TPA: hypothetical protein VJZ71_00745 [Phycisphaerae bacterium]|nr:hypothetical protein [Phycisphaerae bacterium]